MKLLTAAGSLFMLLAIVMTAAVNHDSGTTAFKGGVLKTTDTNVGDQGSVVPADGAVETTKDNKTALKLPQLDQERDELVSRNVSSALQGRGNKYAMDCWPVPGQDWDRVNVQILQSGIRYLNSLKGVACYVNARECIRIACNNATAIYFCNDNNYPVYPQCTYLASFATDIINSCQQCFSTRGALSCLVGGQEFDSDGYNVLVRYDKTNGC